jgi:hypothetical protein
MDVLGRVLRLLAEFSLDQTQKLFDEMTQVTPCIFTTSFA